MPEALSKDQLIEIDFLMRRVHENDLDQVLKFISAGCDQIRNQQRFKSSEEALEFIIGYALVRDIARAAEKYSGHLREYRISDAQLKQCAKIYSSIESARIETRTTAGSQLFNEKSLTTYFGSTDLEELFSLFAPAAPKNDLKMG